MDVYPKDTKGFYERNLKAGWSALFQSSTQREDVKEVVFGLPSREALAARCLQFYLEPYKSVLLQDGEYPKEYKVDSLVTEIVHIYSLLHEPWIEGHKLTIPLMATVSIPHFKFLCTCTRATYVG